MVPCAVAVVPFAKFLYKLPEEKLLCPIKNKSLSLYNREAPTGVIKHCIRTQHFYYVFCCLFCQNFCHLKITENVNRLTSSLSDSLDEGESLTIGLEKTSFLLVGGVEKNSSSSSSSPKISSLNHE